MNNKKRIEVRVVFCPKDIKTTIKLAGIAAKNRNAKWYTCNGHVYPNFEWNDTRKDKHGRTINVHFEVCTTDERYTEIMINKRLEAIYD